MKIKLLHPVLHDGHRAEAGQTSDIEETIAQRLIASGAAVAVEEPKPAPAAGNAASEEPGPLSQPEAGQSAASPTAPDDAKPAAAEAKADAAPLADPRTVEAESAKASGAKTAKEGK